MQKGVMEPAGGTALLTHFLSLYEDVCMQGSPRNLLFPPGEASGRGKSGERTEAEKPRRREVIARRSQRV